MTRDELFSVQGRRGIIILGALLVSFGFSRTGHATALLPVTTNVDEDGTGSGCSLREAIKSANTDTAYGGCYKGSGDDAIYFETSGQTVTLTKPGALTISGTLTIEGYDTTIIGGVNAGFNIEVSSNVTIRRMKLTGFKTTPAFNVLGTLSISKVDIYSNAADSTVQTMGIWLRSTGYVNASDVALRNNRGIKGGGVYNNGGSLYMVNSTITNNISDQFGGGIATIGETGDSELVNCTISGNTVNVYDGGGVYNGGNAHTLITNSTIYNNSVGRHGGGIWQDEASPYGYVTLRNSIVANNAGAQGFGGCKGLVWSYRGNLVGSNECTIRPIGAPATQAPDQTGVFDVKLGGLARVGTGIQWAHTPLTGSPALDKITTGWCSENFDQINTTRPRNVKCDVGSIEK